MEDIGTAPRCPFVEGLAAKLQRAALPGAVAPADRVMGEGRAAQRPSHFSQMCDSSAQQGWLQVSPTDWPRLCQACIAVASLLGPVRCWSPTNLLPPELHCSFCFPRNLPAAAGSGRGPRKQVVRWCLGLHHSPLSWQGGPHPWWQVKHRQARAQG